MSGTESKTDPKKVISGYWRPVYSIYISIIVAFIVTLIMINSHLQFFKVKLTAEERRLYFSVWATDTR